MNEWLKAFLITIGAVAFAMVSIWIPLWYMMVKRKGAFSPRFINIVMIFIQIWILGILGSLAWPYFTDLSEWTSKPSVIVKTHKIVYIDKVTGDVVGEKKWVSPKKKR